MKNKLLLLVLLLAIALAIVFIFSHFIFKAEKNKLPEEKTLEEIIQSLTAPEQKTSEIPDKVRRGLTAPAAKKMPEVSDEIIKSLTAPAK